MNFYKRLIRSRKLRLQILNALSFVPDKLMTSIQYRIKTGRWVNWRNPERYTEKLQVYKTYYRDPLMITCSDKGDVRDYIRSIGLDSILIPCYGIFDSFDQIDFSNLPSSFAAKDTLAEGGNSVIICSDKSALDLSVFERTLREWTARPWRTRNGGREWPYYSGKKHRIIIEQLLESDPAEGGLIDYKFFCFNGVPKYLYVIADRKVGIDGAFGVYDTSFTRLPCTVSEERSLTRNVAKPDRFERMLEIAAQISKPFPHARIDLYNQKGKIYFGEVTFFSNTGYMLFDPDEFDYTLGAEFTNVLGAQ